MSYRPRNSSALIGVLLTACGSGPTETEDRTVATLTLSSVQVSFSYAGETAVLVASARNAAGDVIEGASVTWSTGDATVALVSPTGVVTAVSNGSTTVTASAGSVSGSANVSVDCAGVFCQLHLAVDRTSAVTYGNDPDAHRMNVFEPRGDGRPERPAIVLFAGGGLNVDALDEVAEALVRYGFVVATARYRAPSTASPEEFFSSVVRGGQDLRAAVRYLRAEAGTWRIDTSRMLMGGNGTGGVIAAFAAYVTEDEIPPPFDAIVDALGGLEGDQGNPDERSDVAGVLSSAGGLYEADDLVASIDAGESPLFAVHAEDDSQISIDCDPQEGGTWECGGRAMVVRAQSEGIQAAGTWMRSGGHNAPRDNPQAWVDEFMAWARELLR